MTLCVTNTSLQDFKSACNKYESAGHKRNSATNMARTIEKLLK